MSMVRDRRLEPMIGDVDDHRPDSRWALVVDPGDANGRVDGLAVIAEHIAAGDRIPLHRHRVDELIFVRANTGTQTLGEETLRVEPGAIVFIPAGTAHGLANDGEATLEIEAVFPTTRVVMEMLERNPAPGTESDPPSPPIAYDFRTGIAEPAG